MASELLIRPAQDADVPAIAALLKPYADAGTVLPRSEENIRSYLANFRVGWIDGTLAGCVAVRDFGNLLFEVRSLVVAYDLHGQGVGRKLVDREIARLKNLYPAWKLFTLTRTPEFFERLGFHRVDRACFPEKIWSDCASCPKNDHCDETALLMTSD